MFSELGDDKRIFGSDYGIMADSIFSSHPSDYSYDLESDPYSPDSDDFINPVTYEKVDFETIINLNRDLLMPNYMRYDIEKQPQLLNLVSPNEILPIEPCITLDSIADQYIRTNFGNDIFTTMFPGINMADISEDSDTPSTVMADISEDSATPSTVIPESLEQMYGVPDQLLTDKFLTDKLFNQVKKEGIDLDNILEQDILSFIAQSESRDSSPERNSTDSSPTMCIPRRSKYHPDNDHCYSKVTEDKDVWTPMGSLDSSGSSSEEVDVVTVTEELKAPFVPKVQVRKRKRGQKSQKVKKNSLSPKTFNAAMKRNMTRITTIRRTYRRKINNSVETTPSNSLPSSAPSSRCSSDVEDAGKRANHNSSERKRREVLRTALQNLRLCVPGVQNNLKAPKVQILNCAKEYIREMKLRDQECVGIKNNLKNKRRSLEMKLKNLAGEFILS